MQLAVKGTDAAVEDTMAKNVNELFHGLGHSV